MFSNRNVGKTLVTRTTGIKARSPALPWAARTAGSARRAAGAPVSPPRRAARGGAEPHAVRRGRWSPLCVAFATFRL
jgi:hypothetical protein